MAENDEVSKKSDATLREEKVLEFWRENKIFEKTLSATEGKKEFVFYDGPPTANGKPGMHHLIPQSFKDAIPRYKTMRGYHVRRKGGWDTHGLPVELLVEKELGLKSKKEIESYGIAKFNQKCKESVWKYIDLWYKFRDRVGYWVDKENPYVTYHNDYIESLWNVFKKVDDQNLLYKDYKVVPWCPRCGTALSSHELAQGYEDVKDLSLYVKFRVKQAEENSSLPAYMLAWTTTPWTLPGNVALAVGENIKYLWLEKDSEILIVAEDKKDFVGEGYKEVKSMLGKDLVGMEYEPLYPFIKKDNTNFKIYAADFVNTTDGTGIVHTAVMYGQDDFDLGTKVGLTKVHLVSPEGIYMKGTDWLEGRSVTEESLPVDILKDLQYRGLLFAKEKYSHSYPFCWRCKSRLIYYARDSWYIRMSSPPIKKELISQNQEINWEPPYIREGRFGEWLKDIKDWAISRERYWGTPMPVWQCVSCKKIEVIGSITDLKARTKKSGNKYFVMRHGGTKSNELGIISFSGQIDDRLTEEGKEQVSHTAQKLIDKKIDLIISSPFTRTRETASIIKEEFNLQDDQVMFDDRLHEINTGDFDGKDWNLYHQYVLEADDDWFDHRIPNGESLRDVAHRTGAVLYDLENRYRDKNILIVTHGGPAWLLFVNSGLHVPDDKPYKKPHKFPNSEGFVDDFKRFHNGEVRELPFVPVPHNVDYELDLHKPYIDEIVLVCECGGDLLRTKEVIDVWFDSGVMPFAQDHYPFDVKEILYPADFISEAIDQTRGWFYTLHAVGILMGRGKAYKNVICLGHLLDANGKKMSKSVGNVVDPWEMIEKYGVDTLRLWMYSINQPGESKNFDEKTVALLKAQIFGLLYNVLAFYELYRDRSLEPSAYNLKPTNVLDRWILARLDELIELSTENLDNYKLLEPVRGIRDFIGDLSTWYLRRSRERIKNADKEARQTLYFVLKTLAKIMAPFAPFTAEDIWLRLKNADDVESVHLASWPMKRLKFFFSRDSKIISEMEIIRDVVSGVLMARQTAGMKVRQPLQKLKIQDIRLENRKELIDLIKDEVNVKEIVFDVKMTQGFELDVVITPALKAEGEYREFMRELQDERKKLGLNPGDKMPLSIEKIYKKYKIMPSLQDHMLRVAAVATLICDNFNEPVNKEEIVGACLLHDMGNIIKFKLETFPKFLEPEGLDYWQGVQNEFKEKYAGNEHEVTAKIVKELGFSDRIIFLVDQVDFLFYCRLSESQDMASKIVIYADSRVDPHGVVSFEKRMDEGKTRYKNHKSTFGLVEEEERKKLETCGQEIEKQIFAKCKIKPEDINDETVAPIISELRNFVIK